jgi:hypothetical protein
MASRILVKRISLLFFIILATLACMINLGRAGELQRLRLEIEPTKQIYSNREGLVVKLTLTANEKTKLCLAKDILSQMQISISRPGQGKMALQPLIIQDNSKIFQEPMKVQWLDSGQRVTLRANLKRFRFVDSEQWTPGEYNVNATFNLCAQTPTDVVTEPEVEIPIKAVKQGWFMIMI